MDKSSGYEAIAEAFTRTRRHAIGPATVRHWAKRLPPGASVLGLGCGFGVPISEALLQENLAVHGIDGSPTLVANFRERFPNAQSNAAPSRSRPSSTAPSTPPSPGASSSSFPPTRNAL